MATRWGIVSCGKISNDFSCALKLMPTDHDIVAVAARSIDSANQFAKRFDIPHVYGSYEELASSKSFDVAYIGAIHPTHLRVCKLFINAGHNVLCEKPMAMNKREAQEIFDLAREKGVFFMEAYWSRFFPIYEDLRNELASGCIGEVQHATANFGFNVIGTIPRIDQKELGGGGLLDIGVYPIQFVQMVYNHEKPQKIIATGFLHDKLDVDEMVTATFMYSNNRMATITCSVKCSLDQTATVYGSKPAGENIIKIPKFWSGVTMVTPSKTYNHPLPKSEHALNFENTEGMMYEAQAVRESIKKGLKEHPLVTWDMSLQFMEILDEIRRQIGMVYPQDQQ